MNLPGSCDSCGRWESSTFSPPRWRKLWGKIEILSKIKGWFPWNIMGIDLGIQWNTCRLLWRLGRLGVCKLSLWKFRRRISCYELFFWNGRWRNLSRIWVLNCELFPGQQDLEKMDGLLRQQLRGSATVSLKRTPFLTPRYHFQPCIIFGGMINHWFSLHLITYSTYKSL